jgi:hypothetical protein
MVRRQREPAHTVLPRMPGSVTASSTRPATSSADAKLIGICPAAEGPRSAGTEKWVAVWRDGPLHECRRADDRPAQPAGLEFLLSAVIHPPRLQRMVGAGVNDGYEDEVPDMVCAGGDQNAVSFLLMGL